MPIQKSQLEPEYHSPESTPPTPAKKIIQQMQWPERPPISIIWIYIGLAFLLILALFGLWFWKYQAAQVAPAIEDKIESPTITPTTP